jgi:hypothetical protein
MGTAKKGIGKPLGNAERLFGNLQATGKYPTSRCQLIARRKNCQQQLAKMCYFHSFSLKHCIYCMFIFIKNQRRIEKFKNLTAASFPIILYHTIQLLARLKLVRQSYEDGR